MDAGIQSSEMDNLVGEPPNKGLCILLVEDNPGDARLVREALSETPDLVGKLIHASTLAAGLEAIETTNVDVALLDLGLPDASGLEAVEVMARAAANLPIIVLTGLSDSEVAVNALRVGAQDYLDKNDLNGRLLERALRYAMERKRLQTGDRFLAEAARLLAGSLEIETTIGRIADLATQSLADYCVVDLTGVDDPLHRFSVSHRNSANAELAHALKEVELDRSRPHLAFEAIRTLRPVLVSAVSPAELDRLTQSEQHASVLRALAIRSYMAVPMIARDRLIGVLLLISSTRTFDRQDLAVAARLGWIAAFATDNAGHFHRSREALRTRDRVLGVVAHDLRNPLSTIAMSAELIMDERMLPEKKIAQIQIIRRSADRMDRLIEDLLDVARIENDRLFLRLEHEDPAMLVREVAETNVALAAARSITIEHSVEHGLSPIQGDHDRLMQVLANLVGNAIKFTPQEGVITVSAETDGECVRFSVRDTGPGMSSAELSRLFEPFWQARRGRGQGAGLGLAIAKGIVEGHRGRIWAESQPGAGTTVFFTIPFAPERRADPLHSAKNQP
jgi:signal transduction histidine kinase